MTHAALAPWASLLALLALQAPAGLPERCVEVVLAVEGMV